MEEILTQIASVDGVVGAWVHDASGTVLAERWSDGKRQGNLPLAGESVRLATHWLGRQYGGWDMLAVQLTEGLLVIRNLQLAILGVVARSDANPAVLNVTLNATARRLKLELSGLVRTPLGPGASSDAGRAVAGGAGTSGRTVQRLPGQASARGAAPVSSRVLADLRCALAEQVGPAAGVLAKRVMKRMGLSREPLGRGRLSEFVTGLQECIDTGTGRQAFRQAARRVRQLYDV